MKKCKNIIPDNKKRLIKGIVRYDDCEVCKNATVVISMRTIDLNNKEYITDIGYTISNEKGEFSFIVDLYIDKRVDYIVTVSNPLIKLN